MISLSGSLFFVPEKAHVRSLVVGDGNLVEHVLNISCYSIGVASKPSKYSSKRVVSIRPLPQGIIHTALVCLRWRIEHYASLSFLPYGEQRYPIGLAICVVSMFGWYWYKTWVVAVEVFRKLIKAAQEDFRVPLAHLSEGGSSSFVGDSSIEGENRFGCAEGKR